MRKHKASQRLLAIALSIAMVLGMMPVTASANTLPADTGTEIIALERLAEETENQTVSLGTSIDDLDLPDTLTATVLTQATDESPDKPAGDPVDILPEEEISQDGSQNIQSEVAADSLELYAAASGENPVDSVNTVEADPQASQPNVNIVMIPVTWSAEPEFDGETSGSYVFTPAFPEIYTLAEGVEAPVISVTVETTAVSGVLKPKADDLVGRSPVSGSGWALASGELTIESDGGMSDWIANGLETYYGDVTSVVIIDGVTAIGDTAFASCEALAEIEIPNTVGTIGEAAFAWTALTAVTIPASVTSIGTSAFSNCINLKEVNMVSVTSIGSNAFQYCAALTEITIPASVANFGSYVFACCESLREVTFLSAAPPAVIGNMIFYQAGGSLEHIYVPVGAAAAYKAVASLALYTSWIAETSAPNPGWTLEDGALTIESDAGMSDWIANGRSTNKDSVRSVEIQNGVSNIGNSAFSDCGSLAEVTIPASVTGIGYTAFAGTTLTTVTIPASVTSIGYSAFAGCAGLESVTFQGEAPPASIGNYVFISCTALEHIYVPTKDSVTAYKAVSNLSVYKDLIRTLNTSAGIQQRSATLDLTTTNVTYYNTDGDLSEGNPKFGDITDTGEGWTWFLNGSSDAGYAAKTLVLNGIDLNAIGMYGIKLPANSTIVLGDGSRNTIHVANPNSNDFCYGIHCIGNLTVKGSGELDITSGSADSFGGVGLRVFGSFTLQSGTIYAKAIYGSDPNASPRSLIAYGVGKGIAAFQKSLDDAYSIKASWDSGGGTFVYSSSLLNATDIMLVNNAVASAAVGNKTVPGTREIPLSGGDSVTITLTDETFSNLQQGENVSGWFDNLPQGLTATVGSFSAASVTVIFSGTPGETSDRVMEITIPASKLTGGAKLKVAFNSDAKFNIMGPRERTTLNLAGTSITYQNSIGTVTPANPQASDILNTGEGWTWYLNANAASGYPAKTLVLNGINVNTELNIGINLPGGSTIVLADGSENHVSTEDSTFVVRGIQGAGDLVVTGDTGSLQVTTGNTTAYSNIGISSTANLTIKGGTSIIVSAGGAATLSIAIFASNAITISNGTIYAKPGSVSDISGLSFPIAANGGITDAGMAAFQRVEDGYTKAASVWDNGAFYTYTYDEDEQATDLKIIKQVPIPTATVGNKTVSGITGTPLSGNDFITITLANETFTNLSNGEDVSGWFGDLPQGLTAVVGSASATIAVIRIYGTPGEVSDDVMTITIPANRLTSGEALSVVSNSNTVFDILEPVGLQQRTTILNLAGTSISYQNKGGVFDTANPQESDITNSSEGWAWYLNENSAAGYSAKTLVLNGLNLNTSDPFGIWLPSGSTIVLADGSENSVHIADSILTIRGIIGSGDMEITGDTGSLHISSGNTTDYFNTCLYSVGNLIISGGEITVDAGNAREGSFGISVEGELTISNGTIYAKSGSVIAGVSIPISAVFDITDTGMSAFQNVEDAYTEPATVSNYGGGYYRYFFAGDQQATDLKIVKAKSRVNNTAGIATVIYGGTTIELTTISGLFTIDGNAGAQTYMAEEGGTGAGTITGSLLTVTKAGTLNISLTTAETVTHQAGGKVTATLTVEKGTQTSPAGLGKNDVTAHGGSDGKITGLSGNTVYEYKKGDGSYITITTNNLGEIASLGAGTYVVRIPESALYSASPNSAEVIIGEPGADSTPPTGTITVKSNTWTTFLNKVTFGLFFKNTVDITITANDDSGDIVAVAHFISDTELSEEEVRALTDEEWTKGGSFSINQNKKAVIYARLTDTAGNKAYVSSNGMVVYSDSAAEDTSISFTKGSNIDVDAAVQLNGNTIARIMNGTSTLSSETDYSTADGVITFKAAYLESLGADSYTLTVYYNPMGEAYAAAEGNDSPAVTNISLTVSPAPVNRILVEGITVSGGNTITAKNGTLQLTAQITPVNATNKAVLWSIQNGSAYADISPSGILTAKGDGTATVRAAAQDGSNVFGEVTVTISGQTAVVDNGGNNGTGSSGAGSGTEKITVDIKEGNTDSTVSTIIIERTTGSDGKKKDSVTYQKEKAEETVQKLKKEGKDTARIVIPESKEEISETQVNIPSETVKSLSSGEINLRIDTETAKIDIAADTLKNISQTSEDLYFRLVPVKDEKQKESVASHALVTAGFINTAANGKLELVGSPVTIETNMPSTPADITLPLTGVKVPSGAAEREALLKQMAVYIEHSDGEKELVQGELVEYGEGIYGIRIHITKFSVFTLVKTDAFKKSSESGITGITSPSGAVIKGTKITAAVGNETGSVTIKVKVSEKASWKLYSNKACTKELAGGKLKLKTGSNTAYIRVTAEDGTGQTYQVAITREKSSQALITKVSVPEKAKIEGKTITAAVANEISKLTVKAEAGSKASWKLYSDKKCTNEIADHKLNLKEGVNKAYLKVTAENGKTSQVYTLRVTRKEAPKAQYETHIKLGLIGSKPYAQKVAEIFEENYDAANVTIKQEGKYYRVTMDFADKTAAKKACNDMIERKYIVNYYFYE
jgi:hypothetical protein